MRIEKLSFHNHVTGWQLTEMEFDSINLLVGVSGVGKTKTLDIIKHLKGIIFGTIINNSRFLHSADGIDLNGVSWDITFSTSSSSKYRWHGKYNTEDDRIRINDYGSKYLDLESRDPEIEIEELYLNGELITSRKDGDIKFGDLTMPKLSRRKSLIEIFCSEDKIVPVINSWLLVANSQAEASDRWLYSSTVDEIDGLSLSDIRNKQIPLIAKIGLLYFNFREVFDSIKSDFLEVFPQIENLTISITNIVTQSSNEITKNYHLTIIFKEIGVDQWIKQSSISMGMLKTIAHITEIYLLAEGSILLIDEFENSLGVNCMDVVSELLNKRQDIQFILTSHHPYIINKIPMKYWKVITRKGSLVTAHKATDYEELSGSKHQAFTQLINLSDYTTGIQAG
jgi:AAA domain, putative AbiEii toxin, Type IV TA system